MNFTKTIIFKIIYQAIYKTLVISIQNILDIIENCFFLEIEIADSKLYPISIMLIFNQSVDWIIINRFINCGSEEINR